MRRGKLKENALTKNWLGFSTPWLSRHDDGLELFRWQMLAFLLLACNNGWHPANKKKVVLKRNQEVKVDEEFLKTG